MKHTFSAKIDILTNFADSVGLEVESARHLLVVKLMRELNIGAEAAIRFSKIFTYEGRK